MSATYMHLKEMDWLVETNESGQISGIIDNKGEAWRPNDAVTWVDFQEELGKQGLRSSGKRRLPIEEVKTSKMALIYRWRRGIIKILYMRVSMPKQGP